MIEADLFNEFGHCGELAILIMDRHVAVLQIVVGDPLLQQFILPPRSYRFHFAIRMHIKDVHGEVSANGLQKLRTIQQTSHRDERVIDHAGIDSRASFRKLPIGIAVDALTQPVVDSFYILGRWKERMGSAPVRRKPPSDDSVCECRR